MQQSTFVSQSLTFRSPLPVPEVRSRINGKCLKYAVIGWITFFQGNPAELFGQVRGRRVRLRAPHYLNNREPVLVGTLEEAVDGGTILRAQFRMSSGSWNRGDPYNAKQMDRIAEVLARISGLIMDDVERT